MTQSIVCAALGRDDEGLSRGMLPPRSFVDAQIADRQNVDIQVVGTKT
jgi:hypothetical protein